MQKPKLDKRIIGHKGKGLIQLFEGHGKGKTTAALGEAIRAAAAGLKVLIIAFDKGGENYSERRLIKEKLADKIELQATGRNRIDKKTGRFDFSITEADKQEGRRALSLLQTALKTKSADLIILDEINSSANLNIIEEKKVLEILNQRPNSVELILTGRDAPQSFKDQAHLITEMKLIKHYFYSGVKAREGLDY